MPSLLSSPVGRDSDQSAGHYHSFLAAGSSAYATRCGHCSRYQPDQTRRPGAQKAETNKFGRRHSYAEAMFGTMTVAQQLLVEGPSLSRDFRRPCGSRPQQGPATSHTSSAQALNCEHHTRNLLAVTRSDLVVITSARRIFAFFGSAHGHAAQILRVQLYRVEFSHSMSP
jgi:hypothetical protein